MLPENYAAAQVLVTAATPTGHIFASRLMEHYFPDPRERAWRSQQIAAASVAFWDARQEATRRCIRDKKGRRRTEDDED